MASQTELAARAAALLSAEESPLRQEAAELLVDHVLGLPVSALVDAEALAPLYVAALSGDNVERAVARHLLPGIGRVRGLLRDAGETVGDAVPDDVRAKIEALAAKPDGPRFAWLRGALDAGKLRDLLAPAIQQVLLDFVRELPLAGGLGDASGSGDKNERGGRSGLAAGLVGRLGREVQKSTERLVSVGRSVADGLGVEKRLADAARDFSQRSVASVQRALRERMRSPRGQALLLDLSRGVVAHVLSTPVETILADLDRLPLEQAVGLSPATVAHNLSRELGRAALEGELRAWLALEGGRTLAELLGEAQLLDQVRALAVERANASSAGLFASPAFAAWLARVLSAAGE